MQQQTALVPGSLAALAKQSGASLAESFLSAEALILIDVSGSMSATDSRGGKSRFDVAIEELAKLQASMPGKWAVLEFSSTVRFVPGGQPFFQGGGTDLAAALQFAKVADIPGAMRFFVVSDGEPSDERAALELAKEYKNKISCVYVGPEEDFTGGQAFLKRLAAASGGECVTADRVKNLASTVERLMLAS